MNSVPELRPDPEQIRTFLETITVFGEPFEIRVLGVRRGPAKLFGATQAGFFTDVDTAAHAIAKIGGRDAAGVYVTMNKLDPIVLNWGQNQLDKRGKTTGGEQVTRLRHLLIDVDPVRPKDTNATENEWRAAREKAREVYQFLHFYGWESPVWAGSSGNGFMLLYRIDLPLEQRSLLEQVLTALDGLFSDERVKIDKAVRNAAQLVRVAGTINAKAPTPQADRPWRLVSGNPFRDAEQISIESLTRVADLHASVDAPLRVSMASSAAQTSIPDGRYDVPALLAENNIAYRIKEKSYGTVYELQECLTSTEHNDGACIIQFPNGAVAYRCLHDSCADKRWQDVKAALGLKTQPMLAIGGGSSGNNAPSDPDWDDPIPFDPPYGPPFPLHALPQDVRAIAETVAEQTQTPVDMPAILALATVSAAAGGQFEVSIPEWGWKEPVHGHFVVVAEPASRKSGVFRILTEPIVRYEQEILQADLKTLAEWESRQRVLSRDVEQAEKRVGTPAKGEGVTVTEAQRMAAVAEREAHLATRPRVRRFITDDATPEAVKSLLADQGGAIAIMSAESAFLSNISGRYSDAPNLDVLLNGHAGDAITVDRKGKPHEIIHRASLTLGLTVQPQVIQDLGSVHGFRTRGGAARLLVSIPEGLLGRRSIDVTPASQAMLARWNARIRHILERRPLSSGSLTEPRTLVLAPDALERFRTFRVAHERQLGQGGAHAEVRDWSGKLEGTVLRLAGLMHVSQHDEPEGAALSRETIERAIELGEYFTGHARIMYRMMGVQRVQREAETVLGALEILGSAVSKRDLYQKLRGQSAFHRVKSLDEPLELLEELGYIKEIKDQKPRGGRPSTIIYLNPRHGALKTLKTLAPTSSPAGSEGIEDIAPCGASHSDTKRPVLISDFPRPSDFSREVM